METVNAIGVMSGTSMDGLDLAYCSFTLENGKWKYTIHCAETIPYDEKWLVRLSELPKQPIHLYAKTDAFYGKYIGMQVKQFMKRNNITDVKIIASHGHTIFHQPDGGYTAQIGSGAAIYAETGITTVCDFRSVDVALGGQGAPLVPIGDELLFSEYDACINLGGFANISYKQQTERVAFDVCACNILLNNVARQAGMEYDENGNLAREGNVVEALLNELNGLDFFTKRGAKSMGREWVEQEIWPVVGKHEIVLEDLMATFVEHMAMQVASAVKEADMETILMTGGGVYNSYLMERIAALGTARFTSGSQQLIEFKEALIFGFLGVLRIQNKFNALSSVTGAKQHSLGGAVYGPLD
ncbi:MAG: anhydro-N-acetylmuramic acid kinase [Bacteroidota bacterium]